MSVLPRYPVYIPSKGRPGKRAYTARCLAADGVPFRLVVEPQESDAYAKQFGDARVLVLPFANLGKGSIPARNWIKAHAISEGYERHWQLDDNIRGFYRWHVKRFPCEAGLALRVVEDFSDRYTNVAVSGLDYTAFARDARSATPFILNVRVYSCTLVNNRIPHLWRGRYNEDTDLCLQVLAAGWCTVLFKAFLCDKLQTMKVKGGNTAELYKGDGRLRMARALERVWPGVVDTRRRFDRPQHVVADSWAKFDTPLKRREDLDWDAIAKQGDVYGIRLEQRAPIQSKTVLRVVQSLKEKKP